MQVSAVGCALLAGLLPLSSVGAEPEPSAVKTATKEQYFACLDADDSITERKAKLAERERLLKELDTKFQAAEADLAAQVRRHAPSTKAEIESYNRAIASRNATAQRFNLESRSLQVEHRALNDLIVATNTKCGGLLVTGEAIEAANERRKRREPAK